MEPTTQGSAWKRGVVATLLLLFLTMAAAAGWIAYYAYTPGSSVSEAVIVDIPRGSSVKEIGQILGDKGVLEYDIRFPLVARLSGKSSHLQAGEFEVPPDKTVLELIEFLVSAKPVQYAVTIPEGYSIKDTAALLEEKGICEAITYENLAADKHFIRSLGFEEMDSLEGYLFPDTYYLTKEDTDPRQFISMQVSRFNKIWDTLEKTTVDGQELMSKKDTVILASMVEKETGAGAERALIAGVFFNRLKKGMKLQSDPTVVYGVDDYQGKITRTHLKTPTPYNTYVIPGLPAGPIANPGEAALRAVLHPEKTSYLYFVAKNDGTHHFSATLREHNRAVRKYQR